MVPLARLVRRKNVLAAVTGETSQREIEPRNPVASCNVGVNVGRVLLEGVQETERARPPNIDGLGGVVVLEVISDHVGDLQSGSRFRVPRASGGIDGGRANRAFQPTRVHFLERALGGANEKRQQHGIARVYPQ
jgi:hypothetical protein